MAFTAKYRYMVYVYPIFPFLILRHKGILDLLDSGFNTRVSDCLLIPNPPNP
jgi:hypothetical protein